MVFGLTKSARNVVLGFFALGLEEDLFRTPKLYQITQIHVGGVITAARSLLHVVGDNNDRVIIF